MPDILDFIQVLCAGYDVLSLYIWKPNNYINEGEIEAGEVGLAPEDIEPDSLVQFLNKALEDCPDLLAVGKWHQSRSQFKKCISIWDWLKYSNAAKNQMNILKEN